MRLVALYRRNSEQARPVYEFIEMFRRRYPEKTIEELDIDTRDGAAEATLYGVMQYPAIIATSFDGRVLGMWEGLPLPLIDEVAGAVIDYQPATV
jgi:hypothetical protein